MQSPVYECVLVIKNLTLVVNATTGDMNNYSLCRTLNCIVFVCTSSLSPWWQLEHAIETSAKFVFFWAHQIIFPSFVFFPLHTQAFCDGFYIMQLCRSGENGENTTECLLLVLLSVYELGNQDDACRRTHRATSVITVPLHHIHTFSRLSFQH